MTRFIQSAVDGRIENMDIKLVFWMLLATSLAMDVLSSPIQFPDDSTPGRSVEPHSQEDVEPKFFHHSLHEHRKKKKKKRKKGCLLALHRGRNAEEGSSAEGRFFFAPLINYYDTDIFVINGQPVGGKPSAGNLDPCSALVSGAGSVINAGTGIISGLGGLLPGGSNGVKPQPPSLGGGSPVGGGGGGSPAGGGGGDNGDEDYDYSDGGDSDTDSSDGSSFFSNGVNTVSNTPVALSNVFNSITNGIRPLFERPNRYFDYYVVRPFNRSVSQLFRWF